MCCDKTTTKYPKQCGVTTFHFLEIFGNTYKRVVQQINAIDVGRECSNYPKNAPLINFGDPSYEVDNHHFIPLPDDELEIDLKEHKNAM